jgi:hypothetical protein
VNVYTNFPFKTAITLCFDINVFYYFHKIKNKDDFWVWAKSGLVDGIRAGVWYNNGQPIFLRGYINDKQSRIMGYATMRQLRVRRGEQESISCSHNTITNI